MKTYLFKSVVVILLLLTQVNCKNSRDDVGGETPVLTEVNRLQIVTLDAENAKSGENYTATLNSKPITVSSSEDHKIVAVIPIDANLGKNDLVVNGLNKTYHFNVNEGKLIKTSTETVNEYLTVINSYTANLDNSAYTANLKNDIESFKKVFNNASAADKEKMALFYQNNKSYYDGIVLNTFGKNEPSFYDYDENFEANVNLNKYKGSVLMLGASVAVMILAPDPFIKSMAFLGVLVSMEKSLKFGRAFMNEQMVTIESGMSERPNAGEIKFTTGMPKVINLITKKRGVVSGDSGNSMEKFALFFKTFGSFDRLRNNINSVAQWLNNNVPFSSFTVTPKENVPASQASANKLVNATTFPRFKFTVENPAVILENPTFSSAGKASFNLKFADANATQPITTKINYTYKDDYANLSGSIPVIVEKKQNNLLVGTWKLQSLFSCNVCVSCISEGQTVPSNCGPIQGSPACAWNGTTTFNNNFTGVDIACNTRNFTYSVNPNFTTLQILIEGQNNTFQIAQLDSTTLKLIDNGNGIATFIRQ